MAGASSKYTSGVAKTIKKDLTKQKTINISFGEPRGYYEGQCYKGKKHGKGTFSYINGDKFEGQFQNGKREGPGKYTFADGKSYSGVWRDNKYVLGSDPSENSSTLCVVCQDKQREMAFTPCNHRCLCINCAHFDKFKGKCPVCRQHVTGMLRIYG